MAEPEFKYRFPFLNPHYRLFTLLTWEKRKESEGKQQWMNENYYIEMPEDINNVSPNFLPPQI